MCKVFLLSYLVESVVFEVGQLLAVVGGDCVHSNAPGIAEEKAAVQNEHIQGEVSCLVQPVGNKGRHCIYISGGFSYEEPIIMFLHVVQ